LIVDTRPIVRAIVADLHRHTSPAQIARRFHSTIAHIVVRTCERIRGQTGLSTVALSGGVFMNALLTSEVELDLKEKGFCTLRHTTVPTNDGGISLGQLAIAARQLSAS
jgi:hydrogenase maturation protein HypF